MKIVLSDLLKLKSEADVNDFLEKISINSLTSTNIKLEDLEGNWQFVGGNSSNASSIDILRKGEKGVIERLSNAIDSVIEKNKNIHNLRTVLKPDEILKKAFPKFNQNRNKVFQEKSKVNNYAYETANLVSLVFNSSGLSTKPTVDIIDLGTGIYGKDFQSTILSLQGGNKISTDKSYLIGSFGQGGSTSLSYCLYTMIISKIDNKYFFTLVKKINLNTHKNHSYVYLTNKADIFEVYDDIPSSKSEEIDEYLNGFTTNDSGLLVRMVETEISKEYRNNDITKATMFIDYVNTELFNVPLPIKVLDNRQVFVKNEKHQGRHSYGTASNLRTTEHVKDEYSGIIDVEHNDKYYKIEFFVLLPIKEEDWANDAKCRDVFKRFNIHLRPIIYTVNGQYINGERFTKLKNAGLNFLENRLLVNVDLDILGSDKYRYFTPDRDGIRETDDSRGFLDKIVQALAKNERLQQINEVIGAKSLTKNVDGDLLEDIASKVVGLYDKYISQGGRRVKPGNGNESPGEEIYYDEIRVLEISTKKEEFKRNENVNITVRTKGSKIANDGAKIYGYLNGKSSQPIKIAALNSKIFYDYGTLNPGEYKLKYELFEPQHLESNEITFAVLEDDLEVLGKKLNSKINLNIKVVSEKSLISDLIIGDNYVEIILCLDHDDLIDLYVGYTTSQMTEIKNKLIKPVALFTLFMKETYNLMTDENVKNSIMVSYIKSLIDDL